MYTIFHKLSALSAGIIILQYQLLAKISAGVKYLINIDICNNSLDIISSKQAHSLAGLIYASL